MKARNRGMRRVAGVVVVGLAVAAGPGRAEAARRPDPLPDESGCSHYRGTASGNDPSVRFDVVLCPHDDGTAGKVQGKVQWSSLLSGWNLRRVEGQWSGPKLALRDLEIIEERPDGGFYFCTIDSYALERQSNGSLTGRYDSEACNDHATLTLTPLAEPAASSANGTNADPTDAPPDAPPVSDPPTPAPSASGGPGTPSAGCGGCDVAWSACLLPLVGLRRRRRHAGPAGVRAIAQRWRGSPRDYAPP